MKSQKNKYIYYLNVLNGLLVALFILYWREIFEDSRSMLAIVCTLTVFLIYEAFVIMFTESKSDSLSQRQSINLFMGFKVGKILLSLLIIAIYAAVVKVELKNFIMVFVTLYFIYLIFDTFYFFNREKDKKKNKNDYIEKLSI